MKKTIFRLLAGVAVASTAFTSCKDMMTIDTGDKLYTNANDTIYSYLGIMRAMQDIAERQVILGEIRGDLVSYSDTYITDTLRRIADFENTTDMSIDKTACSMLNIRDYYNVINNCNFFLKNCDLSKNSSNVQSYMLPEYAQVLTIRSWVYLQLVKNYGEVPYITEPIDDVMKVTDIQNASKMANKDNLVDLFDEDNLGAYYDVDFPTYSNTTTLYGSWENGAVSINAHNCFIPTSVVLGDAYLLRGQDKDDYETAALWYQTYLFNEDCPMQQESCTASRIRGTQSTSYGATNWGTWAFNYTYSPSSNELMSAIPSSSNTGLGKILSRVADIYGYTPTSSQSSGESTSTDADGNTSNKTDANGNVQYEASGAVTVSKNYKAQFTASPAYTAVNEAQTYVSFSAYSNSSYSETLAQRVKTVTEKCDARYGISVEDYTSSYLNNQTIKLCAKAARGNVFYYMIPIYRKGLVWLRLAEAINRLGYPEYAFAILKDGLNKYTLPTIGDRYEYILDANGRRILDNISTGAVLYEDTETRPDTVIYWTVNEEGVEEEYTKKVDVTSATTKWQWRESTIENDSIYHCQYDYTPMYYVNDIKKVEKFNETFNFSNARFDATYGIHARGAGFGDWINEMETTNGTTSRASFSGKYNTNIAGIRDSIYFDYDKLLLKQGIDRKTASEEDVINAVENIIVDELALETAFEGNRFTDLIRIAQHKEKSGKQGKEWLAKKISTRDAKSSALYSKLLNENNWYLSVPK